MQFATSVSITDTPDVSAANPIIKNNGQILDSNGFAAYLPTHVLFLISTLLVLATFVPLFFAARQRRAREAKEPVR